MTSGPSEKNGYTAMRRPAQVSSLGRFRNVRGVVSTPLPKSSGYVQVNIHKRSYYMHRLVALAFALPRTIGQDTVNHKDGNPSNDRVENLEWASQAEQVAHSFRTNTKRKSNAGRLSKPVLGRKIGTADAWTKYASVREAARTLQLKQGSGKVSHCCHGKAAQTGGYEFTFDEPTEPDTLPGEEWRDCIL